MKCPDCGKRLLRIIPCPGEWYCPNDDCPANKGRGPTHAEYYGITQNAIDKQKHISIQRN